MTDAPAYTAPPRATLLQKLGPGGLSSYLLTVISTLALAGLPVALRLRRVLRAAREGTPTTADLILVLGRRLKNNALTPVFEARLAHALALWKAGYAPRILVAGGITGRATLSEGAVGRAWLAARGVPTHALFTEDRSQHTLENLFWVRDLMRHQGWNAFLLVSDPLHLARAQAMSNGLGLQSILAPAPQAPPRRGTVAWWRRAVSEAFLLHWYHTGMIYSRLIRSRRQLARVT